MTYEEQRQLNTLLIKAIRTDSRNIAEVKRLLDMGASANATYDGTTALMYAVKKDNTDIVRLLMNANADTAIKDDNSQTVFDHACESGAIDCIPQLTRGLRKPTPTYGTIVYPSNTGTPIP